jgi:periodic tryptophan protein 1
VLEKMEDDQDMQGDNVGTMVTSLAWVSRGFAKALIDTHEPSIKELKNHQKIASKLPKGKEMGQAVKQAEQQLEQEMADLSGDSEDNEDGHVPTFTPELALLKGEKIDDAEMDEDAVAGDDDDLLMDPNAD